MAELKAFKDHHAAIVLSEDKSVEVHFHPRVGQWKPNNLDKLSCQEYFQEVQKRENLTAKIIYDFCGKFEKLENELSKTRVKVYS